MVKIDKAKSIKISHKLDVSYVSDWENHRTKFPLYPLSRKPCLMTAKSIEFWRLGDRNSLQPSHRRNSLLLGQNTVGHPKTETSMYGFV